MIATTVLLEQSGAASIGDAFERGVINSRKSDTPESQQHAKGSLSTLSVRHSSTLSAMPDTYTATKSRGRSGPVRVSLRLSRACVPVAPSS